MSASSTMPSITAAPRRMKVSASRSFSRGRPASVSRSQWSVMNASAATSSSASVPPPATMRRCTERTLRPRAMVSASRVVRLCAMSMGLDFTEAVLHGRCIHTVPPDHARSSSAARRNMTSSTPNSTASSPASYDPIAVERKWQERWRAQGTNSPNLDRAERPFYQLMMFPYPSAEGLHIGNVFAFTGNDIYGRFQRLQGHTVFEPIGFDAFGIHSENYALKVGIHPMELIPRNIENFRRQLRRVGLMVDWSHELSTTDPAY